MIQRCTITSLKINHVRTNSQPDNSEFCLIYLYHKVHDDLE